MKSSTSIEISLPQTQVLSFFFNHLETWLRLNPQWQVLSVEDAHLREKGHRFPLEVRYDEGDEAMAYDCVVEAVPDGHRFSLCLNGKRRRSINVCCTVEGGKTVLRQEERGEEEPSEADRKDLDSWVRSVAWYLVLQSRNTLAGRIWKGFIDRIWLRMSPSGRRVVLIVLMAEGASFLFFLLFLIIHFSRS